MIPLFAWYDKFISSTASTYCQRFHLDQKPPSAIRPEGDFILRIINLKLTMRVVLTVIFKQFAVAVEITQQTLKMCLRLEWVDVIHI